MDSSFLVKSFAGCLLLGTLNPNNFVVVMGWGGRRVSYWLASENTPFPSSVWGIILDLSVLKASEGGSPQL